MTQASDLGAVANQQGAFYRARVNANIQAAVTNHYGATEPPIVYANMIWFSAGDGYIKVRSPTNSSWQNIGTIGPPLKWTNIDLPQENFVTGDIKGSYSPGQPPGWQHLNDGTIGSQYSGAQSRSNPDCWPLFNLLWQVASDEWCPVYAASSLTRTGRAPNPLADWNANHHIALPRFYGRVPAAAGWGAGLTNFAIASWHGQEWVTLNGDNIPPHVHTFSAGLPAHTHGLTSIIDNLAPSGPNFGEGAGNLRITNRQTDGGGGATIAGTTSTTGNGTAHFNIQPTVYVYYFIKL